MKCKTEEEKIFSTFVCRKISNSMFILAIQLWSTPHSSAPPQIWSLEFTFSIVVPFLTKISFLVYDLYSDNWTWGCGTVFFQKQNLNVNRKTSTRSLLVHMLHYLFFLIEFIYLSPINNLWCNTQWYANEQFKFNEFLMTKQIISRARCGVHVIWEGMNLRALFNVWVQTG